MHADPMPTDHPADRTDHHPADPRPSAPRAVQTPVPGNTCPSADPTTAALWADGFDHGAALVLNIRTGRAAPLDLATLVHYLADGPMLAGGCTALHRAIAHGADLAEGGRHG